MGGKHTGVGCHTAVLMMRELDEGEVARFPRPRGLFCYAGLVPKVAQSGDGVRHGQSNRRSPVGIDPGCMSQKVKARRGGKVAIVAIARHLVDSGSRVVTKPKRSVS